MMTRSLSASLMLVGTTLLFGFVICSVVGAESIPFGAEAVYPESLDPVREFHEKFDSPSMRLDHDPDNLSTHNGTHPTLEAGSIFGDDQPEETFQGVVAINTDKHSTTSGVGQLDSVPVDLNYMDIDVSKIIVISINTARGGSSIATSEIFIKPVQNNSGS